MQMGVARHKLCERVDDGNDGPSKLLALHASGNPKRTCTGHAAAFGAHRTSQLMFHVFILF
jgi:hypothetical protein